MINDSVGCQYTDSVNVHVRPAPDVNLGRDTTLSCGVELTLDAGYYGYPTTYTWNDNSIGRTRLNRGADLPEGNTMFFVTVTSPDHCMGTDSLVMTGTGSKACRRQDTIVYPNPNNGIFFISLPELSDMRGELYSLFGQLLETIDFQGSNLHKVDFTAYSKGAYIIQFSYSLIYVKIEKLIII